MSKKLKNIKNTAQLVMEKLNLRKPPPYKKIENSFKTNIPQNLFKFSNQFDKNYEATFKSFAKIHKMYFKKRSFVKDSLFSISFSLAIGLAIGLATNAVGENEIIKILSKGDASFYSEYVPEKKEKLVDVRKINKKNEKVNKLTFEDVKGNEEAKEELTDIVDFLKNPEKYEAVRAKPPKGVLLYGPPGCGKTLLAKALANEAGVSFLSCESSSFDDKYVGVGASRVKKLFNRARKISPCIIFIDEIDLMTRSDFKGDGLESANELLVQMDGFKETENIIVIGSTNLPKLIDKAIIRSGRFDRSVQVSLPEKRARKEIFELYLKNSKIDGRVDLETLSKDSLLMSGADIANVVNSAKILAAKEDREVIIPEDFADALLSVSSGVKRLSLRLGVNIKRKMSVAEAATAIVTILTPHCSVDLRKISIVPRGNELSSSQKVVKNESELYRKTRESYLADLDSAIAGQIGEELIFGEGGVTSSTVSRLEKASNIARIICGRMGLGDKLGFMVIKSPDTSQETPEELKNSVDEDAIILLKASCERARRLLRKNLTRLKVLSDELLVRESIGRSEVETILQRIKEDQIENLPE